MTKKLNADKRTSYKMRTRMIDGKYDSKYWEYNHHIVPPISSSSAYRLNSVHRGAAGFAHFADESLDSPIFIYERLEEPTRGMLEEKLACAEGGQVAVCFSTGMAAISAALGITTKCGDQIVAHQTLYGCTYSLLTNWLPRNGVTTTFIDMRDSSNLSSFINDKTRIVFFETPVNPTLELIDITEIKRIIEQENAQRADDNKILLLIDNTFATPICQRPLLLGADMVIHSLTKNIGGFGADMGGVVICSQTYHGQLLLYRKDFGGVLSSKSAWPILVYGLPTLSTRMVNQQKSALHVARFLEAHPIVERVSYPGLNSFPQRKLAESQMFNYDGKFAPGSVIYFVLKGDSGKAQKLAEKTIDYIAQHSHSITLAVSLGQIRTLIEAPFCMTHSTIPEIHKTSTGVAPGGIRLSLGLEDWHDIISDLDEALNCLELGDTIGNGQRKSITEV